MISGKKKILVLGGTIVQKDLVEYLRQNSFDIHVCGTTIKDKVKRVADHYAFLDICDVVTVNDYIEKNNIDLVYSLGSDIAIFTASFISGKRSLPKFVSHETVHLCNDKFLMRKTLSEIGIPVPKFQKIDSINEKIRLDFPFIMKPVDGWGQKGVYLINDLTEFNSFFSKSLKFSRSKNLIIEEYINGPEVSVNAYMIDGEVALSIITDRIPVQGQDYGLVQSHLIPSTIQVTGIDRLVQSTAHALKINNGPVYFQVKIKDNIPFIVEMTPRLDGCHLWRLIKYYSSIDLLDITVKHLLGDKPSFGSTEKGIKRFNLEFIYDYPNELVDRDKYTLPADCRYLEWYYSSGEKVLPINEKYEKIGYFITEG